ncbi:hypothetical protein KCP76_25235 [Salmonella enterica subsp. enterica serovar Weltevreden]|nr:hypothetical protein KCP76_25235 [Salmonella enterica subsp. enterica serovar Weltevreden]
MVKEAAIRLPLPIIRTHCGLRSLFSLKTSQYDEAETENASLRWLSHHYAISRGKNMPRHRRLPLHGVASRCCWES